MKKFIIITILMFTCLIYSQIFTEIPTTLPGVYKCSIDWGDYDNDGDLDILIAGQTGYSSYFSDVYRNDSCNFILINAGLQSLGIGSVDWGDYDNDGDLDILIIGTSDGSSQFSKIYRNDLGSFVDINAGLPGFSFGDAKWGDYDNDGDLDILLTGKSVVSTYTTKIYRNDCCKFIEINSNLSGVCNSSASWGDFDNDGDLDILLCGTTGPENITKIYRNDNGIFTNINASLIGICFGSSAWGDYDNDGDLDILVTGSTGISTKTSKIYRNNSDGTFVDANAGLSGAIYGSVSWSDFDNDGDLDLLITGSTGIGAQITKLYRNDSGVFNDAIASQIGVYNSSTAWGDYDNDGDLDVIIAGYSSSGIITKLYKNNASAPNTIPNSPTNLTASVDSASVILSWSKATDTETPQDGLSYNLYLGKSTLGNETLSSLSDNSTGFRKVVNIGNTQQNTTWTVKNLTDGTYYWGIQAVDHTYAGSEFALEQMFFIGNMYPPGSVVISNGGTEVTLTWTEVAGAASYKIFACDDPYGTFTEVTGEGTFDGTSWVKTLGTENKLFYYIVAVSE